MIADLQSGFSCDFTALVMRAQIKKTKKQENYADLEVRDRSASVNVKVWGWDKLKTEVPKPGDIVRIQGAVEEWNDNNQIKASDLTYMELEKVPWSNFLPVSLRPAEEMLAELVEKVRDKIRLDTIRAMLLDML